MRVGALFCTISIYGERNLVCQRMFQSCSPQSPAYGRTSSGCIRFIGIPIELEFLSQIVMAVLHCIAHSMND